MDFYAVLDQIVALLQGRGRVAYRALKQQFQLDDEAMEALKDELIHAQQLATDEEGKVLVWKGAAGTTPAPAPSRAPLAYTPSYLAEKILTSKGALEGERKQVTVLFADLKGSMELLADRDPEEARHLLDPVLERMMAAVHRYEGTVNQVMGDGIMALFGAPIAHEDHAVRAGYAALAMQTSVKQYAAEVQRTRGVPIQIRVGLNGGEVVVRAIGSDLHMDYTAVGQTVHLAARMEQLASPGTILVTAAFARFTEGSLRFKPLGRMSVKGLAEPMEVFELASAEPARVRFPAAANGLSRFVGRQAELQALHKALELARAGRGQIVAVIGEPGVGKSRLFYEFTQALLVEDWRILDTSCVSYTKDTPYLPVRHLLAADFQIDDRDDERSIQEKVEKHLTPDVTLWPIRPALLTLLDVIVDDPEWQALDPHQRQLRMLDGMRRFLLRQSQTQPLLVIVENLHWIDAGTQAFLDSLVESLPAARLLLLVNYRPEYQHGWGSKTYYAQLRLDPLSAETAEDLLGAQLGDAPELQPVKRLLIERTEGNPFFLEESIRTLVETQVLVGERGAYRLAKPLASIQVPARVQAILAARIDRLPAEEKHVLQCAAVVGREVTFPLLQAIGDLPADHLHLGLAHLQAAEFLYESHLFPELAYTFKHALTQEVAYASLLQDRRRALHARIVASVEQLYADRLATQVERLAYHAVRGEVWTKAVAYSRQAGMKAMARSAHREAVGHLEQALGALPHLPEQCDTVEQAIDLRLALRSALRPLGDFERIQTYLRGAESLAVALDDPHRLGQVSLFLSNHFHLMGAYDQAIAAAQRALTLATASREVILQALANHRLGQAYQSQGDYRRAIGCLGQTVASLEGERRRERFGQPFLPAVISRAHLAECHAELGTFAEGRALGEEGLQIAEAVAHPPSLMYASCEIGKLSLRQGDLSRALPLLERALGFCHDADLPAHFPLVAVALGAAHTLSGRVADAVPLLRRAMEQTIVMEVVVLQARCHLALGEAQVLAGRLEEAHALAERVLALSREHQERGTQAYALRLLGEIVAQREPPECERAEAYYRQALTLADELGMRPLQAHGHRGLGTLYAKIGRREQAHPELASAIALYYAMDMTFWLPQAETALAQVEGR